MKDLQYYISHPKIDAHNHLNLGMQYASYKLWSGITIPNFPRKFNGLDEMHDVGRSFGSNSEGGNGNNTLGAFGVYYDASGVLAKKSSLFIR